jgi:hypothetical protein
MSQALKTFFILCDQEVIGVFLSESIRYGKNQPVLVLTIAKTHENISSE